MSYPCIIPTIFSHGNPNPTIGLKKIDGNITWPIQWEGEQALPALARALRSERLAVKAAQMNPKLLRVSVPWEKFVDFWEFVAHI